MGNPGRLARLLGALAIVLAAASWAGAQTPAFPEREVRIVVGSAPGGGTDFAARLIAEALSRVLGQPVIVDSRPGASQAIAADFVAKSSPDGYTLGFLTSTVLGPSALRDDLPYDLERDLRPLYVVSTSPLLLVVNAAVPASDVGELIALAKSRPGELNFGTSGIGASGHFAGALFNAKAGVEIEHVPFKGAAEALTAAAGGEIEIAYPSFVGTLPLIESGRIRALAVTSRQRWSVMPSVPTLDEAGLSGYDYQNWDGVFAPAGLPEDVAARLYSALDEVLHDESVRKTLTERGLETHTLTSEEFKALISRDLIQTIDLAKAIGLKAE